MNRASHGGTHAKQDYITTSIAKHNMTEEAILIGEQLQHTVKYNLTNSSE